MSQNILRAQISILKGFTVLFFKFFPDARNEKLELFTEEPSMFITSVSKLPCGMNNQK